MFIIHLQIQMVDLTIPCKTSILMTFNLCQEQYAIAVNLQRETQAAVDIQRIFRGYVVRNQYQYLQREERERRENQRMAATEIQRRFRYETRNHCHAYIHKYLCTLTIYKQAL